RPCPGGPDTCCHTGHDRPSAAAGRIAAGSKAGRTEAVRTEAVRTEAGRTGAARIAAAHNTDCRRPAGSSRNAGRILAAVAARTLHPVDLGAAADAWPPEVRARASSR